MQEMNLNPQFTSYTKVKLKLSIGLNVRIKNLKLVKENRRENLSDFGFGNDFLNRAQNL